jgi:hypothetical protein
MVRVLVAGNRRYFGVEVRVLAAYVRDKRIPLELCPSSNVQTGASGRDIARRLSLSGGTVRNYLSAVILARRAPQAARSPAII